MITFDTLGSYGRLGNQMFQYAMLYSVGCETGFEIKIPDYNKKIAHGQNCLLGNFNISAKFLSSKDKIKFRYVENRGDNFTYKPIVYKIKDGTNFKGYFQNYKYFEKYKDDILKEFTLKENIIERNRKEFIKLKEKYKGYDIVSLHLRRGDIKYGIKIMYGNEIKNSKWYQYFMNASKHFKNKKVKFLIFTGGNTSNNEDSEYNWCKNNFNGPEFINIDVKRTTINDMALMLFCDHNILSPASTFSWWIGFLNLNKNKKIIIPRKFLRLENEPPNGFFPKEFILE